MGCGKSTIECRLHVTCDYHRLTVTVPGMLMFDYSCIHNCYELIDIIDLTCGMPK